MSDTCIVCKKYEPNHGAHICTTCLSRGKSIVKNSDHLVIEIDNKIVMVGTFSRDQVKSINTVVNEWEFK